MLSAMRRHGLNAKIQEHACGVLSGLCLDPATHEEFVSEEGISTVLSAMMVHPYQPGIQAFGCDILASVASYNPLHKQMVIDGNIRSIAMDASLRHMKHNGVQNRVEAVLKAIS